MPPSSIPFPNSAFADPPASFRPARPAAHTLVRNYFSSGWAFLIPYLGIFGLFAWQGWSVAGLVRIFQGLHWVHLAALIWIAREGWLAAGLRGKRHRERLIWLLVPWGLLALLIHLPGVYLEMPSDPWAHFARVNDWNHFSTPLANPEWKKSGSLLVHSLVRPWASTEFKVQVFGLCATGFSLLYYWQYYRLSRACGLGRRAAWCAVLVNLVLFGNNIFGFHRYYGMSTTVLAQIGVLAAARLAVLGVRGWPGFPPGWKAWAAELVLLAPLSALIALNHVQGLALVGMALMAAWTHRLVRHRPRRLIWVALAWLAVNVLVVFFRPRQPDAAALYQSTGWLNTWYGFNLLDPHSPAFERAGQVVGLLGLLNLLAGAALVFRRPVVAWLTILPVAWLLCPATGILFAHAVNRFGPAGYEYIPSFNRLFLGIPSGLALCCLASALSGWLRRWRPPAGMVQLGQGLALPAVLLLFTCVPASAPYFNRFWHVFMRVPGDLQMAHVTAAADLPALKNRPAGGPLATASAFQVLATPGTGFVLAAFGEIDVPFRNKWMLYPVLSTPVNRLHSLELALKPVIQKNQPSRVVIPSPASLFSPGSQAGLLSGHWLVYQVALEQAGAAELEADIRRYYRPQPTRENVRVWTLN